MKPRFCNAIVMKRNLINNKMTTKRFVKLHRNEEVAYLELL